MILGSSIALPEACSKAFSPAHGNLRVLLVVVVVYVRQVFGNKFCKSSSKFSYILFLFGCRDAGDLESIVVIFFSSFSSTSS